MNETPVPRFPEAEPHSMGDERTSRERTLTGDWYVAGDFDNARIAAHARTMLHHFERAFAEDREDCWDLLRSAIPGLGDKARLLPPVCADYGNNIAVGEEALVNYGLVTLDATRISTGAHYQIGSNVQLLTPIHPLESTLCACPLKATDPITIGDDVWLGGRIIVCPSITIGNNYVTGTDSVVTKDISANNLAVDNPVWVLCQLDDSAFDPRHQHPPQETPQWTPRPFPT